MTCYNLGLGSIKHAKPPGDKAAKKILRALKRQDRLSILSDMLKVLKVLKVLSTRSS